MKNADQPVAMGSWTVPEVVTTCFPEITREAWAWDSALRLRASDHRGVVLVAVTADRTDQVSRWLTQDEADQPELVARIYGKLRVELAVRVAHRVACEDGTPVRAEHDIKVCVWCGARWDVHDGNGTPSDRA